VGEEIKDHCNAKKYKWRNHQFRVLSQQKFLCQVEKSPCVPGIMENAIFIAASYMYI
jgi:hypothetical protein